MAPDVFDRETLLDLSVNVIPLFIILAFIVLFAVVAPFGYSLVDTTIQMALLIVPFIGLAVLTYYSGKAIAGAEEKAEQEGELAHGAAPDTSGGAETTGAHAGESNPQTGEREREDASDGSDAPDATEGNAESAIESRSTTDQN